MPNITVRTLPQFEAWLRDLRIRNQGASAQTPAQSDARQPGNVESVGGGVYEMREHFGPGWRMYYVQRGKTVIVLLAGGSKETQARDIAVAKRLATGLNNP